MKYGFIRVAAAAPEIKVADCSFNADQIIDYIRKAEADEVKLLVFPELVLTGYTCGDLFLQELLLSQAKSKLSYIISKTRGMDVFVIIGLPLVVQDKLYNVAACVQNGKLLGFVPKLNIPNYSEFYEARHFTAGKKEVCRIPFEDTEVPFGGNLVFQAREVNHFTIGVEICEDVWGAEPPSGGHAKAGAYIISNLSASNEITGKGRYRRELMKSQSARLLSAYIFSDAGDGESTTDLVFAGDSLIAENGQLLSEAVPFRTKYLSAEVDLSRLYSERKRINTWISKTEDYIRVEFSLPSIAGENQLPVLDLKRTISPTPFVPKQTEDRSQRCNEVISIQAAGLKKRLSHTGCKTAVLGVSGGLDSTLALLVTARAFEELSLDKKGICAVTMPCFGTTDRTYKNAVTLVKELGAELREIPIHEAVEQHFRDISHDRENRNVVYENAQARERTQVLMDIANDCGGLVIGTGDLSELALGWATYNGDHMSMYGVNASVPKTLIRYLVNYFAEESGSESLSRVLRDILDTPVSPELLPPKDGVISQRTEELVGPYELHDFFLYYIMRYGYRPAKVYHLANIAFNGQFEADTIKYWLRVFISRFFSQQFKRSCLPDGPKVGSVALSPRGDWRMPSDACAESWLREIDLI